MARRRRRSSRRNVAGVTCGMSTASTAEPGRRSASSASRPGEQARPPGRRTAGLSRVNVTGRVVGTGSPTTTTSAASTTRVERVLEQGPAVVLHRRLVGAAEPRGPAAGQDDRGEACTGHRAAVSHRWRTRDRLAVLRVALVQQASGLEPGGEPGRCSPSWRPDDADLVVFPEAFARDFGEAGSDVSAYAEPLDGPFADRGRRGWPPSAAPRSWPGMFETGADPAGPFNTLVVRGAATAAYRKIHLYDSFGYRESDRLTRRADRRRSSSRSAASRVGLMTCYDLRFPELARALVDARRRGAGGPGGLGRRAAQGRPLADAGARPGDREHRRTSSPPASRGRATPATRWSSTRSATCSPRPATEPR